MVLPLVPENPQTASARLARPRSLFWPADSARRDNSVRVSSFNTGAEQPHYGDEPLENIVSYAIRIAQLI